MMKNNICWIVEGRVCNGCNGAAFRGKVRLPKEDLFKTIAEAAINVNRVWAVKDDGSPDSLAVWNAFSAVQI